MSALLNPTLVLGLLLGIGYAALYHLWAGRSLAELGVYLCAALIGFGLGQWLGQTLNLGILQIGQLHMLESTLGAFLALTVARTTHR